MSVIGEPRPWVKVQTFESPELARHGRRVQIESELVRLHDFVYRGVERTKDCRHSRSADAWKSAYSMLDTTLRAIRTNAKRETPGELLENARGKQIQMHLQRRLEAEEKAVMMTLGKINAALRWEEDENHWGVINTLMR